jgi:hypothetical protein
MTFSILPVELHLQVPNWRTAVVLVVTYLLTVGTEVAVLGAALLVIALVTVTAVELVAKPRPCTTSAIPESFA